jgi:hypothetical protein
MNDTVGRIYDAELDDRLLAVHHRAKRTRVR